MFFENLVWYHFLLGFFCLVFSIILIIIFFFFKSGDESDQNNNNESSDNGGNDPFDNKGGDLFDDGGNDPFDSKGVDLVDNVVNTQINDETRESYNTALNADFNSYLDSILNSNLDRLLNESSSTEFDRFYEDYVREANLDIIPENALDILNNNDNSSSYGETISISSNYQAPSEESGEFIPSDEYISDEAFGEDWGNMAEIFDNNVNVENVNDDNNLFNNLMDVYNQNFAETGGPVSNEELADFTRRFFENYDKSFDTGEPRIYSFLTSVDKVDALNHKLWFSKFSDKVSTNILDQFLKITKELDNDYISMANSASNFISDIDPNVVAYAFTDALEVVLKMFF